MRDMKVNIINEYRVEMELGEDELSDFDVTYDSLDYGDINTRRFLRELADSARSLGVEADMSGKVLIEAFRINGGCRVCFTFLPSRQKDAPSVKQLVKRDVSCVCAVSGGINALCGFGAALPEPQESTLYYDGKTYMLFLFAAPEKLVRCADTAAELNMPLADDPKLCLARCRENGVCLFERGAVRRLSSI